MSAIMSSGCSMPTDLRDAGLELLFRRQLRVSRGCRMDGERSSIADIGDMIEHFQAIDEFAAGLFAFLELEAQQRSIAALQIGVRAAFVLPGHQTGENNLADFGMLGEIVRNGNRVTAMLSHAQGHRLKALDKHEGIER